MPTVYFEDLEVGSVHLGRDKRLWIKPSRGAVTLFNEILNQRSEVVCTVEVIVLLASRPEGAAAGSMNHVIAPHV